MKTSCVLEKPDVRVRLSIFSQLPDPTWDLNLDEVEQAGEMVRGLTPAEGREMPKIGYKGFFLSDQKAILGPSRESVFPSFIHVYGGVVAVRNGGDLHFYNDDKGMENWLFIKAMEKGHAAIVDRILNGRR